MAQTTQLIGALKQALRAHGKTYADVARHLGLSEASVKRLFAQKSFSLQRLDQVCQMLDIEISDLVQAMREDGSGPISALSLEQEQEIVADLELLLVAVYVLNRWSLDDIVAYFRIPEVRCIRHLAKLDRLRLIELLPRNRVKLLVAPNFRWLEDGPIQRFFEREVQSDFFSSRFTGDGELRLVMNGWMSMHGIRVFHENMRRLAKEFDLQIKSDRHVPLEERRGTTMVVAIRPWRLEMFEKYVR